MRNITDSRGLQDLLIVKKSKLSDWCDKNTKRRIQLRNAILIFMRL
jgi:hypothetical protein